MNDEDDETTARVIAKLLDEYRQLVGLAIGETAEGGQAEFLTATVDGMSATRCKAMLIARVVTEASMLNDLAEQAETAPLRALGDEPTLN